ncbi:ribose 5-phosphate isomerase B [Patescibacteria group bacterium]|nr:ribose 5-phosphate isomerase B [Patescibacteria group bacterium]MBU1015900.1 ribose 5-phosphate isomerase B [Patescibacteria group bacterium]MBU1685069.1 ribose 5-phosphate isomerase B [Patescibacteria group bacterium]MBU1938168.1 ribose 5-phosphate isomerase B [Patescibacteria group bacterium]
MQKVIIGSDHAGFQTKERIKKELGSEFEFVDVGTHNGDSVDYPIYAEKVGQQVAVTPGVKGVLVCGSGIGVSIAANKVNGIRAALCYNKRSAELARLHNDANVIATVGREETFDDPADVVRVFLKTDFSGEDRHARRVQQIMDIEKRN